MKTDFKKVYERFKNGDSVTDPQLDILITVLEPTVFALREMGEIYHLAWKEAYTTLNQCRSFKTARNRNK